ncbi:MAG: queuosine salvage family protein [Myxococcota bacterium]|nr:queuosine salvage family protein [Myxococcota bacterium]
MSVFDEIRAATARVCEAPRFVRIDETGLAALAERLAAERPAPPAWDADTHFRGDPAATLAYVVTLDAINFGSGWFPRLRKRAGRSGYFVLALGLRDRFERDGPWRAEQLAKLEAGELAAVLGQELADPEVAELLGLYARALRDLGLLLEGRHGGRFEGLVEAAGGTAAGLVRELARMPLYRDVARYLGRLDVPFYKRAQITAADLALAFEGAGPGRFDDLDRLTMFADNLVPHVLRLEGALVYDEELLRRIEAGTPIGSGAPEEIEIRAAGVQAVERLVEALRAAGTPATAHEVDHWLWHRGQRPEIKAHPRHRSRNTFY